MAGDTRTAFLKAYGQVLTRTWDDETYASRVWDDPAAALREVGSPVREGLKITVSREIPKTAARKTLDDMITHWEKEAATGSATLYLPPKPELSESELSDEQLSAIAGGACCSYTPPCCCCW